MTNKNQLEIFKVCLMFLLLIFLFGVLLVLIEKDENNIIQCEWASGLWIEGKCLDVKEIKDYQILYFPRNDYERDLLEKKGIIPFREYRQRLEANSQDLRCGI